MRRWIILVIAVIVVVGGFFAWRTFAQGRRAADQDDLQTVEVTRGSLMATIGATGTVRANQNGLLSFQTSGTVDEVLVVVGDSVKKGDMLVTLEQTSLPTQVILAQADLVAAEKALEELMSMDTQAIAAAQLNLANTQDALEAVEYKWTVQQEGNRASGERIAATKANLVLAQSEVDRAQSEYSKLSGRPDSDPSKALARSNLAAAREKRDSIQRNLNWYLGHPTETDQAILDAEVALAKANLKKAMDDLAELESGPDQQDIAAAEARIAAAQANLNTAYIVAPFDGMITASEVMPGDQVSPGTPAFQLTDLSKLYVDVDVSEVDINEIEVGQSVVLTFDALLGEEYYGEVEDAALTGENVQGVVNFKVTVEFVEPTEEILPGLTAAANIVVNEIEDVLLVPNRAVRVEDGQRVVYILVEDQPEKVEILLGASSDLYSEVIGGELKEGDIVILNPPADFFEFRGGPPF
ncbi:MAG: efflux RND transporter periplasmic adaptor subunit [Anaerolineales bacterium]|nr:efflux RND transporter periplasmic adaptor subunit [Anaerolineales bacterium]